MNRRKLIPLTLLVSSFAFSAAAAPPPSPAQAARAEIQKEVGFTPEFIKAMPDAVLPGFWAAVNGFENSSKTALSVKDKKLIGLAVAAQAGSRSTIYAFTRCARANGATDAEIGEAVGIAAAGRQFSTVFNGVQLDETKFRAEIAQVVAGATQAAAAKTPAPAPQPIAAADARTAFEQMKQTLGFVPEFMHKLPPEAVLGAWTLMRDLELNPTTALKGKTKSLIGLAVASQIPCRYCITADTEFAKLDGASERELHEAVLMAGMARSLGTLLEGLQVDEMTFRHDFDRMTPGADKRLANKAK